MSPHVVMGIVLCSGMVNAVIMLTLLPLMFWIFVVPRIEKRMGKELKFNYSVLPFGKYFCGYIELSFTITLMYLSLKIFKDKSKINFHHLALVNAKYDISLASGTELIISFFGFACTVFFLISLFLMFLIPYVYQLHQI